MAEVEGVDITSITGSGPGGKIVKQDVERTLVESKQVAAPLPLAPIPTLPIVEVVERQLLKGVRAIIAERMAASVHTTARVTLVMEVDATEFVSLRNRLKEKVSTEWGLTPSYNDLLMRICAVALRQHPNINARLTPEAVEILGHINIGIAVDTERGLMVPVVTDVDKKSLKQIATETKQKIERARVGRSLPDELAGGTFTITNLGMYEVDAFTPVINLPEAAILGVGRITPKPVVKGSSIEIRQMMTLSLAFDHRLVDGAPGAKFLQTVKQLIEEPYLLLAN
jgi:pyruvate dehydrogenase E2 component (dihydrolipoamide acetyltransferase)